MMPRTDAERAERIEQGGVGASLMHHDDVVAQLRQKVLSIKTKNKIQKFHSFSCSSTGFILVLAFLVSSIFGV